MDVRDFLLFAHRAHKPCNFVFKLRYLRRRPL